RESWNQLMAVGLTSVFALQTLVILGGNLKILPLTGVPLPFVAYGGSSLIANFIIIGLLIRLSQQTVPTRVPSLPRPVGLATAPSAAVQPTPSQASRETSRLPAT